MLHHASPTCSISTTLTCYKVYVYVCGYGHGTVAPAIISCPFLWVGVHVPTAGPCAVTGSGLLSPLLRLTFLHSRLPIMLYVSEGTAKLAGAP